MKLSAVDFARDVRRSRVASSLRRGRTQKQLADRLGVSCRTLQYWESGEHLPNSDNVANFHKFLHGVKLHEKFPRHPKLTYSPWR